MATANAVAQPTRTRLVRVANGSGDIASIALVASAEIGWGAVTSRQLDPPKMRKAVNSAGGCDRLGSKKPAALAGYLNEALQRTRCAGR